MNPDLAEPLADLARELRRHDRERYLTVLFAPAARRQALFALYAFNLEVAKTAEVVSEPLIGRIRLQWWRDALAESHAGQARSHPIVEALAQAMADRPLSLGRFERLLDAREADLEREPPPSLAALEDYAAATSGELTCLALEILGLNEAHHDVAFAAGRHLGIAWALIGLLRAVPFHARQKRLYLPADLSRDAGLEVRDLFELRASPALSRVVAQVVARAAEHLSRARRQAGTVPRAALPALLPAVLARRHCRVLARSGYDPFTPAVQAPAPGAPWRLALAALRGRT